MLLLTTYLAMAQEKGPRIPVSVRFHDTPLHEAIQSISNATGYMFAYKAGVVDTTRMVTLHADNKPINVLLTELFRDELIDFFITNNHIILTKRAPVPVTFTLSGKVTAGDTVSPVPYAAIYIKNSGIGTISGTSGNFQIELNEVHLSDTLWFSSLGFSTGYIIIDKPVSRNHVHMMLTETVFDIPAIEVVAGRYIREHWGNTRRRPNGSMYMDTHGQQVALFIANERQEEAWISTVGFYLSPDGNTEAPFRVRIFNTDSAGRPGSDMLGDMVIARPGPTGGWYYLNLERFHIQVPENGFFIAMQGVYPNDFIYYSDEPGFVDLTNGDRDISDESSVVLTYGQQLGYTRNRKNTGHTWHYALSHTWFQLKKQSHNVMISAEVRIKSDMNKKNKKR